MEIRLPFATKENKRFHQILKNKRYYIRIYGLVQLIAEGDRFLNSKERRRAYDEGKMLKNFDKEIRSSFTSIPENARTRKSLTRFLIESRLCLSLSLSVSIDFPMGKTDWHRKGKRYLKRDQESRGFFRIRFLKATAVARTLPTSP